jgi:glutaredoxin
VLLAPLILIWEWGTTPKGMQRAPGGASQVDAECRNLALYQFKTCPFCVKVRREMRRLSLNIDLLDAHATMPQPRRVARGGGKAVVPCLKITGARAKRNGCTSRRTSSSICRPDSPDHADA